MAMLNPCVPLSAATEPNAGAYNNVSNVFISQLFTQYRLSNASKKNCIRTPPQMLCHPCAEEPLMRQNADNHLKAPHLCTMIQHRINHRYCMERFQYYFTTNIFTRVTNMIQIYYKKSKSVSSEECTSCGSPI